MVETGWIQTFSGNKFFPLDPNPADIRIEDVAHALALLCRFGGQCRTFYSVAQHSVHVSEQVPAELALWGLLHDAAEAYLVDVPRPIKCFLTGYREAETRLMVAVCTRFGLPPHEPAEVKTADIRMLETERCQLFDNYIPWNSTADTKVYGMGIFPWPHVRAEREFLERFKSLTKEV